MSRAWRHLAPRAASSSEASSGGPAAAAADASTPPAAGQQQQQQQQQALDFTQLRVQAAFEFEVQGQCLLRVSGPLAGTSASRGGLLAASLVALRLRQRALDAAVDAARQQFPGLLQPKELLDAYDRQRARNGDGAALELLGLPQLHALCSKAAPEVAAAVEDEVAEEGARLRAGALRPVDPTTPTYAAGARWQLQQGFDLPSALARSPKWPGWVARLREAAMQWGREQQRASRTQPAPQPAPPQPPQPQQQPGAARPADKDGLSAAFELSACTPDELPMRMRLSLAVAAPQGRQLLNQIQSNGARMFVDMDNRPGARVLAQAMAADEPLRQPHLQAAAWQLLRLGSEASFECELPAAAAAADGPSAARGGSSGGGSSSSSGSSGGEPFRFSGSLDELRYLTYALHWLEGTELGQDPQSAGAWVPYNGRIRLQRADARPRGLGSLLRRRGQPAAAAGAAAGGYQLAVWPAPPQGVDPLQPGWQPQGEPAVVALGQRQLAGLMDCIDAFASQHPGWVRLELPEPLQAPAPSLRQRLEAWLSGGSSDAHADAATERGSGRDRVATLPPGTRLEGGTPV